MQFLTLSRRRIDAFPPEAFTPDLTGAETTRVLELHAAGKLRQVWRRGDMPGAAIVWDADTEDEVRAALATLPLFKAGMLEIVSIVPLQAYPGLEG